MHWRWNRWAISPEIGAGVVTSLTTVLGVVLGTVIGQAYDGTVLPLVGGFALFGSLSLFIKLWVESGLARDSQD